MPPATVHLDLSEIVATPLRTGIQRVVREAIRHWPGPARLLPCHVDAFGHLLSLPQAALDILGAQDDAGTAESREQERLALRSLMATGEPIDPPKVERLLNLELFFGSKRADLHLRFAAAGTCVLWYLYDFLPFLRPDLFAFGTTRHCMHFLRGLRGASRLAFLSEQTRDDYIGRVARTKRDEATGPVISPGADGLMLERQTFSPRRRDFVALGTVEQRKNTVAVLKAFEIIWMRGSNVRLIVAGRLSPDATDALAFFRRYAADPRLLVLEQPSDERVREILRDARALVMPSEAEGFGLPPYEAAQAGIPAVASARLPSAPAIRHGALLLDRMDPASIAEAVESLCDDAVAARLWSASARLRLPTWSEFGRDLGAWAQAA
jgi:glycosyltransferase involved in cell wall biosynthesis